LGADTLMLAASKNLAEQDRRPPTPRPIRFTPYKLPVAIGPATGDHEYQLLQGALPRLRPTLIRITIPYGAQWRRQQFSWTNEWPELATRSGRCHGIEFVVPAWFYQGVLDRRSCSCRAAESIDLVLRIVRSATHDCPLLNQQHGVGKTTLALHLAGVWSCQSQRVTVIDADPQGCALEWSEMRAQEPLPGCFTVIGLVRHTLHREAPNIARDVDRVLLTADLVLVPVQLPPFGRAAFAETLRLVNEASTFRPQLRIRVVLNRCDVRAVDVREIARALTNSGPPVLTSCIGQRAVLADAVVTGRLAFEIAHSAAAVREITALAAEIERTAR
jgi:chromosome partitioning protein